MDKLASLRQDLTSWTSDSLDRINADMSEITRNFDNLQRLAPQISRDFSIPVSKFAPASNSLGQMPVNPVNAANSGAFDRQMQQLSKELSDAAENIDPNNLEGYLQSLKSITKRMANLLANQPDANAETKELARLLNTMLDLNDPAAMTEKLERIMQLLERFERNEN